MVTAMAPAYPKTFMNNFKQNLLLDYFQRTGL